VIVIVIDGTSAPPPCAGLEVNSSGNTIKGLAIGNFTYGISLQGSGATNNTITGNYVGTDASGTGALGNYAFGIFISDAPYNTIGGGSAGERNVISGNLEEGIRLDGASNAVVKGNAIGIAADGSALPNGASGVRVRGESDDVVIGPDNVIAYNGNHGVAVTSNMCHNTCITRNSIHSNDGWAIYHMDAIPRPSIFDAKEPSSVVGVACAGCTVEVFANPGIDWEGRTFIGDTQADGSGAFTVTVPIATVLTAPYLTATATDVYSGTSWFSPIYIYPLEYSCLPLAVRGN
jgi:hypothetical protein